MIAYEFPPAAAGGVMRTVKFCKYLPELGWEPHVLTPKFSTVTSRDPSMLGELGQRTHVHRTRGLEYDRMLARMKNASWGGRIGRALEWRLRGLLERAAVPDAKAYWAIPAIWSGISLVRSQGVDLLYSTSWPFSDHLTGLMLHRWTRRPWIADFRDPWLQHYNYGPRSERHDRWNRRLESKICQRASFVISATELANEAMQRTHPDLPPEKFITIRNGYDHTDFDGDVAPDDDFSIVHGGTFYGSRNPTGFFAGVDRFLDQHPDAGAHLRITCMGTRLDGTFHPPETKARCEFLPWTSHEKCLRRLRAARVLLMIQHAESEVQLTVPGKLYEYMASGVHILSLNTKPGENEGLLRQYGQATILHDDNPQVVAAGLEALYERYAQGRLLPVGQTPFVKRFTRRAATEQLAALFDAALHPDRADVRSAATRHDEEVVPCAC